MDQRAEPDAAGGDPLRPRNRLDPNVSRCVSRRRLPASSPGDAPGRLTTLADSASWAARARTVTTRCDGRLPCSTAASRATRHRANVSSPASTTPGAASLAISSSRRRPNVGWRSEIEDARIPPCHGVRLVALEGVDARPHAGQRNRVVAVDRRVGPEVLGPPLADRLAAPIHRGIERGVQRTHPPAVPRAVADGADDQQIPGARGGDVGHPDAFGLVARHLDRRVLPQLRGRPAGQADGAARSLAVDPAGGGAAATARRRCRPARRPGTRGPSPCARSSAGRRRCLPRGSAPRRRASPRPRRAAARRSRGTPKPDSPPGRGSPPGGDPPAWTTPRSAARPSPDSGRSPRRARRTEQVAGARRRDVRRRGRLLPGRARPRAPRAARSSAGAQPARLTAQRRPSGVHPPRRGAPRQVGADVDEHHDRELEPLRLVHGHQADAVAALLEDRRLRGARLRRFVAQPLDEAAERQPACRFVLARQLADVLDVGERLLARRPQREDRVRARRLEQRAIVAARAAGCAGRAARAAASAPRRPRAAARARRAPGPAAGTGGSAARARGRRAARRRRTRTARRAASPNTDSSSSGHSIAASAVRSVSTSSRSWKLLPPTSRCGRPRASSAWT